MRRTDACDASVEWARQLPDGTTLEEAWNACPWVSWLGWFLAALYRHEGLSLEPLVLVSCSLVRAMYGGNPSVEVPDAVEHVLNHSASWARGEGTSLADVRNAVIDLEEWRRVMMPEMQAKACAGAAWRTGCLVSIASNQDRLYGFRHFDEVYQVEVRSAAPGVLYYGAWAGWAAWNKTLCDAARGVVPWSAVWAGVQKAGLAP